MSKSVSIVTDFHTHLLPDEDCSGRPEISAELVSAMAAAGVQNIVLTPHFYPQSNKNVDDFLARRNARIEALMAAISPDVKEKLCFVPGAEVLLCQNLEKLDGISKLCFEGTSTILIEMPDLPWSASLIDTLCEIKNSLGLDVVIAHVDRYGKKNAEMLIAKGFKVQVNSDNTASLSMRGTVTSWAKDGYVYALGSDKHVHSSKSSVVYKEFPKAATVLSKFADEINARSLKLIGK